MKKATDGRYVHVACALWIPDVFFGDPDAMEPVVLTKLNPQRRTLKCVICQKKGFPCVQCPVGKCNISFHPCCLMHSPHPGILIDPDKYHGYCKRHTVLKMKEMEAGDDGESVAHSEGKE